LFLHFFACFGFYIKDIRIDYFQWITVPSADHLFFSGALMQGQEGEAAAEEAKKSNHVQRRAVQSGSF